VVNTVNSSNLTLARMSARERELTVRAALGAGKGRLLRQLVTESFILGLLAAGLGMLFASQSLKLLADFTARLTSRAREIHVDGGMLLFALAMALATSFFGSFSALYSRDELSAGLRGWRYADSDRETAKTCSQHFGGLPGGILIRAADWGWTHDAEL
jgi:putative ABC transport system permease protein